MKSARRVSTSRALLAWLVDRHTVVSRFLMVESWPKACWRGGKIEVCFKRFPDLFGKKICALQFESGFSKRSKTKWPLYEDGAVVVTPVLESCPLERVKQFSYCMPSLGRV